MSNCPVCESPIVQNATSCHQCGWKFKYYLNVTEEDKLQYKTELETARTTWQARKGEKIPHLERDVFETIAEYQNRIETEGPYLAGNVTLRKIAYNADKKHLPLKIMGKEWVYAVIPTFDKLKDLYLKVERNLAKTLLEKGSVYSLYAQLTVKGQQPCIVELSIREANQIFPIQQTEDEQMWEWAVHHNTTQAYQQYLNHCDSLKNHRLEAQRRSHSAGMREIGRNIAVVLGGITIALIGTTLGTIAGVGTTFEGGLFSGLVGGALGAVVALSTVFFC